MLSCFSNPYLIFRTDYSHFENALTGEAIVSSKNKVTIRKACKRLYLNMQFHEVTQSTISHVQS